MKIECTLKSITLDGMSFSCGMPLSEYELILRCPSRSIELGGRAPYGHRNNHAHFFDDVGIFLAEHHLTRLIEGVGIVLEPKHAYRKPVSGYRGELIVCGVPIVHGMRPEEFLERCEVSFRWHLGHSLVFDAESISIDIDTYTERTPSGRESAHRVISVVSVGFENAHLLSEAAK